MRSESPKGEVSMGADRPWRFVHVADIHKGSPRSYRFDPSRKENWETALRQIVPLAPDLMLVGGDLTFDGYYHRYELQSVRDDLDGLPFPSYVVPGNHDVGNKWTDVQGAWEYDDLEMRINSGWVRQFATYFGPVCWTLAHRNVRFTGFYAPLTGSGLEEEEQLWHLLEKLPSLPKVAHHVAIAHYPLFMDDLDEPQFDHTDRDQYVNWFMSMDREPRLRIFEGLKRAGVDLFISGHVHARRPIREVDGIRLLMTPATGGKPQYGDRWPDADTTLGFHCFTVTDDELDIRFVPLEEVSTAEGYGPRGHPPPHLRDYSLAWEK